MNDECTNGIWLREDAITTSTLYNSLDWLLKHYIQMVNSGDCGFWDPEKEDVVIAARVALIMATTRDRAQP